MSHITNNAQFRLEYLKVSQAITFAESAKRTIIVLIFNTIF